MTRAATSLSAPIMLDLDAAAGEFYLGLGYARQRQQRLLDLWHAAWARQFIAAQQGPYIGRGHGWFLSRDWPKIGIVSEMKIGTLLTHRN
ncbi:MAG: hypothetical protein WBA88_10125 [Pseudaminobacter sp.]